MTRNDYETFGVLPIYQKAHTKFKARYLSANIVPTGKFILCTGTLHIQLSRRFLFCTYMAFYLDSLRPIYVLLGKEHLETNNCEMQLTMPSRLRQYDYLGIVTYLGHPGMTDGYFLDARKDHTGILQEDLLRKAPALTHSQNGCSSCQSEPRSSQCRMACHQANVGITSGS